MGTYANINVSYLYILIAVENLYSTMMKNLKNLIFLFILLPTVSFGTKCDICEGCGIESCQGRLGPEDKSESSFTKWFNELNLYIEELKSTVDFSIYDDERLRWVRTSFIQPQLMVHDKYLYDRVTNQWTVDKYLGDVTER